MKLAIVHDYLVQAGGAERVVEVFHEIFPEAPIYTSVYNKSTTWSSFSGMDVRTSFIQKISRSPKFTKALIPLYPIAFEQFNFADYNVEPPLGLLIKGSIDRNALRTVRVTL